MNHMSNGMQIVNRQKNLGHHRLQNPLGERSVRKVANVLQRQAEGLVDDADMWTSDAWHLESAECQTNKFFAWVVGFDFTEVL
jgi:hypothetical protein